MTLAEFISYVKQEHAARKDIELLLKIIEIQDRALEDMYENICDGGGEKPCSQMWYQDVIDEARAEVAKILEER